LQKDMDPKGRDLQLLEFLSMSAGSFSLVVVFLWSLIGPTPFHGFVELAKATERLSFGRFKTVRPAP
jgi:hypothetical protein